MERGVEEYYAHVVEEQYNPDRTILTLIGLSPARTRALLSNLVEEGMADNF